MKKQFFTTAVACIAALSISAPAFAADGGVAVGYTEAGLSVGGSIVEDVPLTDSTKTIGLIINENLTVNVEVSKTIFGSDYVSVSPKVEFEDASHMAEATVADLEAEVNEVLKRYSSTGGKVNLKFEISFSGKKADGTVVANVQPVASMNISFTTIDDSNAVYDPGNVTVRSRLIGLRRSTNGVSTFTTNHFSPYYMVRVAPAVANTLLGNDEETTTANTFVPSGGDSNNSGNGNNSNNNNNNNNNNNDNNSGNSNNSGNGSFDIGFENGNGNGSNGSNDSNGSGSNGTGDDVTNGNGNVGNTDGNGSGDKNQATGVVLAVVPAAVAAAAVIISKKRK